MLEFIFEVKTWPIMFNIINNDAADKETFILIFFSSRRGAAF